MTTSRATATWNGRLKDGTGHFDAASGTFSGAYSFPTRFEGAKGSTPEELVAAAHASCFSMALSFGLEQAGTPATRVTTTAHVTLGQKDGAPAVTKIQLVTTGVVPGIDQAAFAKAAEAAKAGCPISKLFAGNTDIQLVATLEA